MENSTRATQRWLDVGPERIEGWLDSFASRHGATSITIGNERDVVTVSAADGSRGGLPCPVPAAAARRARRRA